MPQRWSAVIAMESAPAPGMSTRHVSSDRAAAEFVPDGKREAGMPRLPMVPPGPRVERRLERAFIQTWIESKQVPALTIVGPGGVGKTHLALTVAHDMQRHFRDGVYFISF